MAEVSMNVLVFNFLQNADGKLVDSTASLNI